MSRTTQSKSRAEKKGSQSAPTPAITQEIIPGKYTDQDWNRMIDVDDGDDFCTELIDELVGASIGIIFEKYLGRQLIPYTVSQAKDAILTIIKWQFLAKDEGEKDLLLTEEGLNEEEPEPSVLDCWAQGSVPKAFAVISSPPPLKDSASDVSAQIDVHLPAEEREEVTVLDKELSLNGLDSADSAKAVSPIIPEIPEPEVFVGKEQPISTPTIALEPKIPQKPTEKKPKSKGRYKRHTGKIQPTDFALTETLDDTEKRLQTVEQIDQPVAQPLTASAYNFMPQSVSSILKLQLGRPPGNRNVYYNEDGNVVAMAKISPDKLPSHSIKTKFQVVDPQAEAAQARLEAMRTGRYLAKKKAPSTLRNKLAPSGRETADQTKASIESFKVHRQGAISASQSSSVRTLRRAGPGTVKELKMTPLPPPLIESMEVAPGVVVTEGQRTKRGPRQIPRGIDRLPSSSKLHPVSMRLPPKFSIQEVLPYGPGSPTGLMKDMVTSPSALSPASHTSVKI